MPTDQERKQKMYMSANDIPEVGILDNDDNVGLPITTIDRPDGQKEDIPTDTTVLQDIQTAQLQGRSQMFANRVRFQAYFRLITACALAGAKSLMSHTTDRIFPRGGIAYDDANLNNKNVPIYVSLIDNNTQPLTNQSAWAPLSIFLQEEIASGASILPFIAIWDTDNGLVFKPKLPGSPTVYDNGDGKPMVLGRTKVYGFIIYVFVPDPVAEHLGRTTEQGFSFADELGNITLANQKAWLPNQYYIPAKKFRQEILLVFSDDHWCIQTQIEGAY